MRAKVNSKNESVFFPGGLILVLALIGLWRPGAYTRRLRIGLLVGIVTCSILALGLGLTGAGYPYRLLYDYAPGWDGVRVPGRIFTLATLFYALLAGAGAQLLVRRIGLWAKRRRPDGPPPCGCARSRCRRSACRRWRARAADRHPRRRRRAPRPPGRAAAGARRDRPARTDARPADRRRRSTASGSTSRPTASTRSPTARAPSTSPPRTTCAAA